MSGVKVTVYKGVSTQQAAERAEVAAAKAENASELLEDFASSVEEVKEQILATGVGLPEEFPTPGSTITATTANQWTILEPGTYHQTSGPDIIVAADEVAFAQYNGTVFDRVVRVDMPVVESVPNIVTDDDTKALAASQGVLLKYMIEEQRTFTNVSNNWFENIGDIFVESNRDEIITNEDFTVEYVWINRPSLNVIIGRLGMQLRFKSHEPCNFGLPIVIDLDKLIKGEMIELYPELVNQSSDGLRVFIVIKKDAVLPITDFIIGIHSKILTKNALTFSNTKAIGDRPSSTLQRGNETSGNERKWRDIVRNIYIIDGSKNESDVYRMNYVWINYTHPFNKFGFQLTKNDGQHTNFSINTTPVQGDTYQLTGEVGGGLKDIYVFVEFNNFASFPSDSFLQFVSGYFFNKDAFKLKEFYKPVKAIVDRTIASRIPKHNVINVSIENDGVNAIQNAINSITDASSTNTYEIRVGPGIYKITNSSQFIGYPTYPSMIVMKDHVSIVGDSKRDCIVWAELPYDDGEIDTAISRNLHQTIYNWANNCTVENITFVGKNIRYTLHQDNPQETNKSRKYKNCDFIFLGDKGFRSAMGIGTYGGSKTYIKGGRCHSDTYVPFACHNNQTFQNPCLWSFKEYNFSRIGGACIDLQNSGSLIGDILELNNCQFEGGFEFTYSDVWIYSPNINDSYNHANWQVLGSNNSPMYFNNTVKGIGLKIEALTIGHMIRFDESSSAYPLIIANNKKFFGNLGHPERKITGGYVTHDYHSEFKSYAIGAISIQEDNYSFGTIISSDKLGLRLGDCSVNNKILGIVINNVTYNVTFNKDYTSFTNSQIVVEINNVIDGVGVASEYSIGRDYYPEFTDVNFQLNNDSSVPIKKGMLVKKNGGSISLATTGDEVYGIAIDDIEPSWKNGEGVWYGFGRVIRNMIFHSDQIKKSSGVVILKGKKYSAVDGLLIENVNGNLESVEDGFLKL